MEQRKERGLKQLPDGRWQWSYQDPNGKYRRHITRTKGEARAYLEKVRTMMRECRYLDRRKEVKTTFNEAVERFLAWGSANLRPSTSKSDHRIAKLWLASPLLGGRRLDKITAGDVERYRQARLRDRSRHGDREQKHLVSKREVDLEISRLKRLFNLALDWGLCESNPVARVRLFNEEVKRTRYLTHEEEERLLDVAGPYLRRVILFALHTGMRRAEILGLRWQDVDFRSAVAKIPATRAKGRRDRFVPLNAVALSILRETPQPLDGQALVFGNAKGRPQENLERLWRLALKVSEVENFRFHDLRHTYASRLVMGGVDLPVLRELLGHQDFAMTLRYAHLSQSRLKEAVTLLEPKLQNTCNQHEGRLSAASQVVDFVGSRGGI
ncbi:MAG: tyrosine-type recombinase/integrase [Acidobacteriota bacterium]